MTRTMPEVNIRIKLPEDFSKSVDKWVYELRQVGIKRTKAELITKFAMIGYLNEKRECDMIVNNFRNETEED